jgi:formyltetrahydrofolate synthetase
MKPQLKYIDEWGLDRKAKRIVKRELTRWVETFLSRADNAIYQVELCDFKNNVLFFFTKCQDILKDNPEEKGVEDNFTIRKRKRQIMYALFLKQLIGDKIKTWSRLCSHCGNTNMTIKSICEGTFYRHCPDCKNLVINTYENDLHCMAMTLLGKYSPDSIHKKEEK